MLTNITWIFQIDVTIIGFKKNLKKPLCTCQQHSQCQISYPYYKFQNPVVKLLKSYSKLNIIFYQNNYFYYDQEDLRPMLINKLSNEVITFENITISNNHILDILHKAELNLPFCVNIYSAYYYVRQNSTNQISNCLIGQYVATNNSKVLQLFITPHLQKNTFHLNTVMNIVSNSLYDQKIMCSTKHITEKIKIFQRKKEQSEIDNKNILNQDQCICEHPSTTGLFLKSQQSMFKPLGNLRLSK